MDINRGFEDEAAYPAAADEEPAMERPPEIGVDGGEPSARGLHRPAQPPTLRSSACVITLRRLIPPNPTPASIMST